MFDFLIQWTEDLAHVCLLHSRGISIRRLISGDLWAAVSFVFDADSDREGESSSQSIQHETHFQQALIIPPKLYARGEANVYL